MADQLAARGGEVGARQNFTPRRVWSWTSSRVNLLRAFNININPHVLIIKSAMSNLPTLPVDILLLICEYVGLACPRSLLDFALVSKSWASAAFVHLHRTISFTIVGSEQLEQDVESCQRALTRSDSFKYVHRLEIGGPGPYSGSWNAEHDRPGWQLAPQKDLGESYFGIGSGRQFDPESRQGSICHWETCSEDAWRPLAALTQGLPALKDVMWNCRQTIPQNVLDALEQKQPICRLWMNAFQLRTLYRCALTDTEWRLITSPVLHAIGAICEVGGRQIAAIVRIVSGMAPNIRKLSLHNYYPAASFGNSLDQAWQGFETEHLLPDFKKAHLTSLTLFNSRGSCILEIMGDHTNLSALEHLAISSSPRDGSITFFNRSLFESLTSMELNITHARRSNEPWLTNVRDFLLAIPPLSALKLRNQVHFLPVEQILDHHGSALRRLWLLQSTDKWELPDSPDDRQFDTSNLIRRLPRACALLEELAIPVRRSKGDRCEVSAYRSLELLSKLHTLDLTLDCSDYSVLWAHEDPNDDGEGDWPEPPASPQFDDFDMEKYPEVFIKEGPVVRNGHIRDALMNAAVDENLARSIFKCIAGEKHRLEKVTIRTRGGARFSHFAMPMMIRRVCREVSRDWLLQRNIRDDQRHQLLVKDITKPFSTTKWYTLHTDPEEIELEGVVEQIFRKLWPEPAERSGDWCTQWHSFPLEM